MATTPIEVPYRPGKTLTCSLFPLGSDTATFTGRSLTEKTNDKGNYTCNVTEAATGYFRLNVFEGTDLRVKADIYLEDSTTRRYAYEVGGNVMHAHIATRSTFNSASGAVNADRIGGVTTAATNLAVEYGSLLSYLVDDATFTPTTTQFEVLGSTISDDDTLVGQGITWYRSGTPANRGTYYITASEGTVTNTNNKLKLTVEEMPAAPNDNDIILIHGRKSDNVNISKINGSTKAARVQSRLGDAAIELTVDDATFTPTATTFETDGTITADDTLIGMAGTWYNSSGDPANDVTYFITDSEGTTTNSNNKLKLTVEDMPAAPADGDVFVVLGAKVK